MDPDEALSKRMARMNARLADLEEAARGFAGGDNNDWARRFGREKLIVAALAFSSYARSMGRRREP